MLIGPERGLASGPVTSAPQHAREDYPLDTKLVIVHGLLLLPILGCFPTFMCTIVESLPLQVEGLPLWH